jgi:nucleotide-binding universal stress UspA family protein
LAGRSAGQLNFDNLAVKEPPMLNIRRILHPTDLSANARQAFEVACDFAENYNARLIVVGVVQRPRVGPFARFGREVAAARRELQQALDDMQATHCNICIERRVVEGDSIAEEILRVAEEVNCDLIVMGTQHRTGIERMVLGSVAEEVADKASCPVLPIRDASRLLTTAPCS